MRLFISTHQAAGEDDVHQVKDIRNAGDSSPWGFTGAGATVFFASDDGIHGRDLWKTDGTDASTTIVKDTQSTNDSTRVQVKPLSSDLRSVTCPSTKPPDESSSSE